MKLDSATLVIVSAVIQIILVLVLLHAWRNRETYPGFAAWVAGTAAWSVGGILALILPDLQPRIIPKGIGFGLLFLNPVLMLEGLRQFYGVRRRWTGLPLDLAIAAIAMAGQLYYVFVEENLPARIVWTNIGLAILFGRAAVAPLLYRQAWRDSMQWLLTLSLFPLSGLYLARVRHYLHVPDPTYTLAQMMQEETILKGLLLFAFIAQVVSAYCYLSLTANRTEGALRGARQREREVIDGLRQFINMITHGIKTPLAVIDRAAQFLGYEYGSHDGEIQSRVDSIRTSVGQLKGITDTCLLDTVVSQGELSLQYGPVELPPLLRELGERYRQIRPDRRITLDLAEHVPPSRGDARFLDYIIGIIVDNALKYSPADSPVTIGLAAAGAELEIRVCDHGMGIPPEELDQVGTWLYRAGNALKIPGAGIGLHTVRFILRLHGGSLDLANRPEGGLCVTVRLPVWRDSP